jgi:hypothetical protein
MLCVCAEKADSTDVWSDDEKPAPAKSALKKPAMSFDNDDTLFGSSTGSKPDARRPPSSSDVDLPRVKVKVSDIEL